MRTSRDLEMSYVSVVKRLLAAKPDMTVEEISRQLERNKLTFDRKYVMKLRQIALRQRVTAVKGIVKEKVIGSFISDLVELQVMAWGLAMDTALGANVRLSAMREARAINKQMLNTLFFSGILEKELGTIKVKHEATGYDMDIPPDLAEGFLKMMGGWTTLEETEKHFIEQGGFNRPKNPWWFNNLNKTTKWNDRN